MPLPRIHTQTDKQVENIMPPVGCLKHVTPELIIRHPLTVTALVDSTGAKIWIEMHGFSGNIVSMVT